MNIKLLSKKYVQKGQERVKKINNDDEKVFGLKIVKDYPDNIPFTLAVKKNGSYDQKSLVNVMIKKTDSNKKKIPVLVSISLISEYFYKRSNEHQYEVDFSDSDAPTEDSYILSQKTKQPMNLTNYNDYSFDVEKDKFIYKGKEVSLNKIVNHILQTHIMTSKKWFLLYYNTGKFIRKFLYHILKLVDYFFEFILNYICGKDIEPLENNFKDPKHRRGFCIENTKENSTIKNIAPIKTNLAVEFDISYHVVISIGFFITAIHSLNYFSPDKPNKDDRTILEFLFSFFETSASTFGFIVIIYAFLTILLPKLLFVLINLVRKINRFFYYYSKVLNYPIFFVKG